MDDHYYALVYERFWDTLLPALERVRVLAFTIVNGWQRGFQHWNVSIFHPRRAVRQGTPVSLEHITMHGLSHDVGEDVFFTLLGERRRNEQKYQNAANRSFKETLYFKRTRFSLVRDVNSAVLPTKCWR